MSDPTRVVADADVLAADLLVGGEAREALDCLRAHSWMALIASDELLEETRELITTLADERLATDWHERIEQWRTPSAHTEGDHPALAAAYHGDAAHLLTFDENLQSVETAAGLQKRLQVSPRAPGAFARLFDPTSLYCSAVGSEYPGPDRDPRR